MKISIDATGVGRAKTGTSVYLSEILSCFTRDTSLDHEFVIFASDKGIAHCEEAELDRRFTYVHAPSDRRLRVLWQQTHMPWYIRSSGIDVHWGTGFVLPLVSQVPMAVTIHDLTHRLYPEVHERLKRYYFPAMINASVKKAKAVFAVSRATEKDLHHAMPISVGKTVVTPLAARKMGISGPNATDSAKRTSEDYMLFVGTLEPRKNLPRLLMAWHSLDRETRGNTKLLIVGATGWMVEELLKDLAADDSVRFLGHVDDSELASLLTGARALLYPSLYEGFGLPVVEAMQLGVPVLTANIGATQEIAEGAAVLVDPLSVEDIRAGMTRLLMEPDLIARLSLAGPHRARSFSWEHTARTTVQTLEKLAGR